ncbi:MAG: lipid carrier--UDP-N-acetylgalactosaminyltransferase [Bacteroidetes bacterium]|nr:MAG: lipid carrier--UDP-N-acetylgalactosaminyltransferase [Bacteroidota bacterium]
MYKTRIKQITDFILALIGFLIISPFFVLITIFLFIANKGKPFFFQSRPGKDEKIFKIIKFKTMMDERGSDGELLADAERLTTIGNFVRKTSLDEIPQLLNVLKGDMSLIGPRPLLIQYLPLYSEEQKLHAGEWKSGKIPMLWDGNTSKRIVDDLLITIKLINTYH